MAEECGDDVSISSLSKQWSHMTPSLRKLTATLQEGTEAPPIWGLPKPKQRLPLCWHNSSQKARLQPRKTLGIKLQIRITGKFCFRSRLIQPEDHVQDSLGTISIILNHDYTAVCVWYHIQESWSLGKPVQTGSLPDCFLSFGETKCMKRMRMRGQSSFWTLRARERWDRVLFWKICWSWLFNIMTFLYTLEFKKKMFS